MINVLESVNDWSFHLQDGQILRGHDLLQSYHREPPTIVSVDVPITPASPQTYEVSLRWSQEGRTLLFNAKKRTIKFEMPVGWRLEHTHPDLFRFRDSLSRRSEDQVRGLFPFQSILRLPLSYELSIFPIR